MNDENRPFAFIEMNDGSKLNIGWYFARSGDQPDNWTIEELDWVLRRAKPGERQRIRQYFDSEGRLKGQYW